MYVDGQSLHELYKLSALLYIWEQIKGFILPFFKKCLHPLFKYVWLLYMAYKMFWKVVTTELGLGLHKYLVIDMSVFLEGIHMSEFP